MARYRYLGEPARPGLVVAYGPTTKIDVPKKDGSFEALVPIPPATQFVVGQDIGYDITDQRAVQSMDSDTRFQRI